MSGLCLVIGAGPGIGRAVALGFAREGFDIALAARNAERLTPIADEVRRAAQRRTRSYAVDASDERSLGTLFERVHAEQGPPAVVIYNVAHSHRGRPTTLPTARWIEDFRVNVLGALTCAQLAAPAMRERGGGTILFTGGGFAHEPSAQHASLSVSKSALRSLTQTLAQELGGAGIHVATVTVYGLVQVGTHYDPERIAETYLRLHRQPRGAFEIEAVYR